jgi:hypothetical protein
MGTNNNGKQPLPGSCSVGGSTTESSSPFLRYVFTLIDMKEVHSSACRWLHDFCAAVVLS